jgi:4-amino-4-deoxy-L-arabinose transferase-like glycosyltransferase
VTGIGTGKARKADAQPVARRSGAGAVAAWLRHGWVELVALAALLVIAALLRLPDLATRGTWDGDQGHDMLVLRALVRDGVVPLLGPPTSIGDVHHGAWYYYLLSPAAFLTGGDSPLAVVTLIALAGVAAVGVVWWLGRAVGGRAAGLTAAFVMAISAAAIDESTFIWNPNLIALSSAVALAAAWRAWTGGRSTWWLLAALGVAVTMQCHVLGIALLPVVGALFIADARRRPLRNVAIGVLAILVVAYLPLLVHELTTDFSETRAALRYLSGGREPSTTAIPVRFWIVGLRVVSWPLVGLITAGFAAAVLATAAVATIVAGTWRRAAWEGLESGSPATATRWLGLGLLWTAAFLTIAAPSLASVVPGLPNDHYHAFADPMVFVLVGIGAAAATRDGSARPMGLAVLAGLAMLTGWNLSHLPAPTNSDGGYPAGQLAGERADAALSTAGVAKGSVVLVRSLPDFKSTEAVAYPLALLGRAYVAETPRGTAPGSVDPATVTSFAGLVLLCDDRFAEAIGAPCGGPAESAAVADVAGPAWGPLLDQFMAAPGRYVSVYGPSTAAP